MAGSTDLIGAFKAYAQKALGNDFNPEKAATVLNSWVKESGDALKIRIEKETEKAVKKLGLAKESELRALAAEVASLRKALGLKNSAAGAAKGRSSSRSSAKKSVKTKNVKKGSAAASKSATKKASAPARKKASK